MTAVLLKLTRGAGRTEAIRQWLICGVMLVSAVAMTSAVAEDKQNWNQALGTDLSLWQNVYEYGSVTLAGDELHVIAPKNWFLLTKARYRDFIFEAEVKMPVTDEYSNSGILFRAQVVGTEQGQRAVGYQAEIDPSERRWSGGLYDQGRRQWLHPVHAERSYPDADFEHNYLDGWQEIQASAYRPGEWNLYRVEARGSDLKIYLNDVLTTHVRDVKDAEGHIGLQHHGSRAYAVNGSTQNLIRFKNLRLQEL